MTIKVKIMGNIVTKDGAKFINDIQEFTEKDDDMLSEYSFVEYITEQLREKCSFLGLVYIQK